MLKNILITTSGLSSVGQGGGISSYVHDLAQNLVAYGHSVTVYLIKEAEVRTPLDINYAYKLFRIPPKRKDEDILVYEIYEHIKDLKPDVIINNDIAYIVGLWPVLDSSIVKISVMHGFSNKKLPLSNSGIQGKIATIYHEHVDYIVCQNQQMVYDAAQKYQVPKEKLLFIPQTVSLTKQYDRKKGEIFSIVFAGGANLRKGAEEMFQVCKLLKGTNLAFSVNWCLPAPKYEKYFKDDDRFNFPGQLSRDHFLAVIAKSDCIVIPTHLDTGPMLLVEAMAMGTTPICNNLRESAIPDIITNNENGILVDHNDPKRFFNAIKELIANPSFNVTLANNALSYFNEHLAVPHQIEKLELLFNKKTTQKETTSFSSKNIIYHHLKQVSQLSKYSFKRVFYKIITTLEIPLYKR